MYQTTHGRHAMPLDTARDAHEGMRQGRPSNRGRGRHRAAGMPLVRDGKKARP